MPCPGQLPRRSVCEPSRILEKPGVQRHAATCQMAPQQINPKGLALWQEIGGAHVAPAGEDSPLPGLIDRNFELTILFVTEVGLIINQLAKLCLEGFNDPSVVEQLQQSNVCHCRGHLGPFVDRWQRQRFQDFGLDELLTLGNRLLPIVAAATADVQRRSWPRNAKEKKGEKRQWRSEQRFDKGSAHVNTWAHWTRCYFFQRTTNLCTRRHKVFSTLGCVAAGQRPSSTYFYGCGHSMTVLQETWYLCI